MEAVIQKYKDINKRNFIKAEDRNLKFVITEYELKKKVTDLEEEIC